MKMKYWREWSPLTLLTLQNACGLPLARLRTHLFRSSSLLFFLVAAQCRSQLWSALKSSQWGLVRCSWYERQRVERISQREEEEKRVQVLVVQEAEDLEEEQQREERVQVLHTCQVNMTEIREVSDWNPWKSVSHPHCPLIHTKKTTRASILYIC